jgi:hypothetical protein
MADTPDNDFLRVQGSDLRLFVPSAPTREGDNPLVAIFREVKDLVALAEVARGTRMETKLADSVTEKVANTSRTARETSSGMTV